LDEKVSNDELNLKLNSKISYDDAKSLISNDHFRSDVKNDLNNFKVKIDTLESNLMKIKSEQLQKSEVDKIFGKLDNFVKVNDFNELLELKANKQAVNNALNRKVNKSDLDVILLNKADASSVEELLNMTKTKVSQDYFESQLNTIAETRVDRQEL